MCQLQIINCGNKPQCHKPCAIGVIFCDAAVALHPDQKKEYYLMKDFQIRERAGCAQHDFIPTTASEFHACSDCNPTAFAQLEKLLTETNGDLYQALYGASGSSSSQQTPSIVPVSDSQHSLDSLCQRRNAAPNLEQELHQLLQDMEMKNAREDLEHMESAFGQLNVNSDANSTNKKK